MYIEDQMKEIKKKNMKYMILLFQNQNEFEKA